MMILLDLRRQTEKVDFTLRLRMAISYGLFVVDIIFFLEARVE